MKRALLNACAVTAAMFAALLLGLTLASAMDEDDYDLRPGLAPTTTTAP